MLLFDPATLPPTLIGFLQLLAMSSGAIVSWLWSLLPADFQKLPPWVQGVANFILSALLTALLTWATSAANAGTIDRLNAFYVVVIQFLLTFGGNLGFHIIYHGIVHPTVKWYQAKIRVPSGSQG